MVTGNWGQFWTLATLDFTIYGEADNRQLLSGTEDVVEAIVTLEILDKDGKKLNVTHDEVKRQLYFCQSETGEVLDPLMWEISDICNNYVNIPSSGKSSDSGTTIIVRKYISCSRFDCDEITEKISVGINVPGVGKFNTSRYGTSTKMGSGGVFKSPQSFEIIALRPFVSGVHGNIIDCVDHEEGERDFDCRIISYYITDPASDRSSVTGEDKLLEFRVEFNPV